MIEQVSAHGLTVTITRGPEELVLALAGELDLASVPLLQQQLAEAATADSDRIVIDLTSLRFLDSSGLKLFLETREGLSERHELRLRRGNQTVQRVFDLTCTAAQFQFED